MPAKLDVVGWKEAIKALDKIDVAVRRKVVAKAIRQATRLVARAMKPLVRVKTGLLAKSIGAKQRSKSKQGYTYALIGPRRKFVVEGPQRRVPSKYAHLVERGTFRSKAYPFAAPAFNSTQGAVVTTIATVVGEGIEEAAKT